MIKQEKKKKHVFTSLANDSFSEQGVYKQSVLLNKINKFSLSSLCISFNKLSYYFYYS